MKTKIFLMAISSGVLPLFLTGCAAWTASIPVSRPYFATDQKEMTSFQSLVKKQEGLVPRCAQSHSCDQVYFTLGLLGLYESREVAAKYFEKVVTIAPMGPVAATSKAWLQVLRQSVLTAPAIAEAHTSLATATDPASQARTVAQTPAQRPAGTRERGNAGTQNLPPLEARP